MAPGSLGSSSDAKAWRQPPAFLSDPSRRGRRFLGARIQPLGRGQKSNVLNLTLPWPRGGACLEAELLRQMPTGLGVPGLPQRPGEGRRPQDDLSPEWRPSGNTGPASAGLPATRATRGRSCPLQDCGLPQDRAWPGVPVTLGPNPSPAESPPRPQGDGAGAPLSSMSSLGSAP